MTYEMWPYLPGGTGTFVHHAVTQAIQEGHEIDVILYTDDLSFSKFDDYAEERGLNNKVRFYNAKNNFLEHEMARSEFCSEEFYRSYKFSLALEYVHTRRSLDYVEFFDYCGPAYFSLARRMLEPQKYPSRISVRAHNTIEIISTRTGFSVHDKSYFTFLAERYSCALADAIIAPSREFFQAEYLTRYKLSDSQFVIGKPSSEFLGDRPSAEPGQRQTVVFYGRRSPLKGLDTFLFSIELLMGEGFRDDVDFLIVGPAEHVTGGVNRQLVELSEKYSTRVRIIDRIDREDLPTILRSAVCAVFPNRTESFCYALHEIAQIGVPVIVNDIPGFSAYFKDGYNALVFNGDPVDLSKKIRQLVDSPELQSGIVAHTLDERQHREGTAYSEIIAATPSFAPSERRPTFLVTVVYIMPTKMAFGPAADIVESLKQTFISENIKADLVILWLDEEDPDIVFLSRGFKIDPASDVRSPFVELNSKNIVILNHEFRGRVNQIVQCLAVSRPELVFCGLTDGDWTFTPSTLTAPDLFDLAPHYSSSPQWTAAKNLPIHNLFDMQNLFQQTCFYDTVGVRAFERLGRPVITLPIYEQRVRNTSMQGNKTSLFNMPMGTFGSKTASLVDWSAQHPEVLTIFNPRLQNGECWIVDLEREQSLIHMGGAPLQIEGKFLIHDLEIIGIKSVAIELLEGYVRWRITGQNSPRLLVHSHSGEVAFIKGGKITWVDLKVESAAVVQLSLAEEQDNITARAYRVRPRLAESTNENDPVLRMCIPFIHSLGSGNEIALNFGVSGTTIGLPLWDLLCLPRDRQVTSFIKIAEAISVSGIQKIRIASKSNALASVEAFLVCLSKYRLKENDKIILTLAIESFPFLTASTDDFRGLEGVKEFARKKTSLTLEIETPDVFLHGYLSGSGIICHLLKDSRWPTPVPDKWLEESLKANRIAVFCCNDGIAGSNAAHMLIGLTLAGLSRSFHIDLWDASSQTLEMARLLNLSVQPFDRQCDFLDVTSYYLVLSVYPDIAPLDVFHRCAESGTPFIFGSCSDSLLNREPLKSLVSCNYWEDSVEIARIVERLLNERQSFRDAYRIAWLNEHQSIGNG